MKLASPALLAVLGHVLCASLVLGQNTRAAAGTGRIAGMVIAAESGQPVTAAEVVVRGATDTTIVGSTVTAEDGRFRVDGLAVGQYRVRIGALGRVPLEAPVVELTQARDSVDLGRLEIEAAPVTLDALEARTERPAMVMEADRTTYDARQLPASSGGTATELLRQIPELEVDINGKVALRGSQGVSMQLNGRPLPLSGEALNNYLNQLPANRIAKVEVMPNPSAAHDPSGSGGIVNIILRDDVDLGLSGNLAVNGSTRGTKGVNGRLAFQRGAFTFFGGGSVSFSDSQQQISDVRQNLLATPVTILEQEGSYAYGNRGHNFDLSAELRLNPKTVAWLTGMGYGSSSDRDQDARYGLFEETRVVLDRYDRVTETEYGYGMGHFALGLKHSFVPQRHELIVDVRRSTSSNDSESYVERVSLMEADPVLDEIRVAASDQRNPGLTVRADYNRPWGERGRVSVGVTGTRNDMENHNLQTVSGGGAGPPTDERESGYSYNEDFHAAYTTVSQAFGKLSAQLGLRYELTRTRFTLRTTAESFDNDYSSVFPSLALTWTAWDGGTIRFNYSKRIMRPYPDLLNPFTPVTDPLNIYTGNPDLRAAYTHSYGLNITHTGSRWTFRLAPSYSSTGDNWESIKRVDSLGVSRVTYENSRSTKFLGATLSVSLRPLGRLSGSSTLSVRRTVTDAQNISDEYSRASTRVSVGGNTTYKITSNLTSTVSASFIPAYDLPQGRRTSSLSTYLSVRQQLLNNRGILSLTVNDPFDIYRYRYETRDRTHVQTSRTTPKMRAATLSFTWNFGKPPQQNSRSLDATRASAPVIIR